MGLVRELPRLSHVKAQWGVWLQLAAARQRVLVVLDGLERYAYCLMPTALCLLPYAYCLMPTALCLCLIARQRVLVVLDGLESSWHKEEA